MYKWKLCGCAPVPAERKGVVRMKSLWKKTAAVIIAAGMVAACSMPALAQAQEKTQMETTNW